MPCQSCAWVLPCWMIWVVQGQQWQAELSTQRLVATYICTQTTKCYTHVQLHILQISLLVDINIHSWSLWKGGKGAYRGGVKSTHREPEGFTHTRYFKIKNECFKNTLMLVDIHTYTLQWSGKIWLSSISLCCYCYSKTILLLFLLCVMVTSLLSLLPSL